MKRLVLLNVMFVIALSAMAQDTYHPLLKDGKCWYGKEVSPFIDRDFTCNYYLSGDTLIGNELFQKCYRLSNRSGDAANVLYYYAALQEKDRRVYAVVREATEKKLILDFNLQVGDSLHCEYGQSFLEIVSEGGDAHYVLEKIDSVAAVDGSPLRRYWFEGVGTNSYPFNWNFIISSYGYALQGCYEEGVLFYGNPIPESIMMLNMSPSDNSNSQYFDLQGRRLNGKPAKGMYIQNGKKYVK